MSYRGAPILKIFVKNRVKGFLKVSNPPPPSAVKVLLSGFCTACIVLRQNDRQKKLRNKGAPKQQIVAKFRTGVPLQLGLSIR